MANIFSKEERLCSNKLIEALFSQGNSFIVYPLRIVYRVRDEEKSNVSVLISVSKKKFKRAVKRNRTKRLIKEAYRLNKSRYISLSEALNKPVDIAFLYIKNELPEYPEIESAVKRTIDILTDKLTDHS